MNPSSQVSPHMDQALRRELTRGERLIWSAQPRASMMTSALWIWLFAIPWTLFALFWESGVLSIWSDRNTAASSLEIGFGVVFAIFGLPFIAIGFWMLWKPVSAMRKARDTIYGLTDMRLIRVVEGSKRVVASVALDQMGPMDRTERRDGWGTLRIQTHSHIDTDGEREVERFEVVGIPDVAGLERLIHENRVQHR